MPGSTRRAICWIRRDLRLHDNAALARATELADEVIVLFVFDTQILGKLVDKDDRRVTLIHRCLTELDQDLSEHGSRLLVRHGDPVEEVPAVVRELQANLLVFARDYEPYAVRRDTVVSQRVIRCESVKDNLIHEPDRVASKNGGPIRVFTPFSKAWKRQELDLAPKNPNLTKLAPEAQFRSAQHPWSFADLGFTESQLPIDVGERAAQQRLEQFAKKIHHYAEQRDFPALNATSGLSPHLRFGSVSVREMVSLALTCPHESWLNEIIWREFYAHLLFHFPEVVNQPFQPVYRGLNYPNPEGHFAAWAEGGTGFPIVDAAMRQLKATGLMHNRLRMITASFLTKDLLVDYRLGEAHFARYLLDFDLASNNGGWQWSASVGADAQPYFRVFNPLLQSQKFDPNGDYIAKWLPELASLPSGLRHAPGLAGGDYPLPIVDHATQKDLAVTLLKDKANLPG